MSLEVAADEVSVMEQKEGRELCTETGASQDEPSSVDEDFQKQKQEQEHVAGRCKDDAEAAAPQELDNFQQKEAEGHDAQNNDEVQEAQEHSKKTKPRRQSMHALVMAGPQALEDAKASLAKYDGLIEEAKMREAAAQVSVDEANQAVLVCGEEVKEMCRVESECIEQMACLQKRKREAAKDTALKRSELQSQQDLLVLLEMEQARVARDREKQASQENEQAAKRQKIDELQRVLEDAKKAHDAMKERERQARAEMRLLVKEQKQCTKSGAYTTLGAFGRRQRASQKAKAASPQKGRTGDALAADVADSGAADASAAVAANLASGESAPCGDLVKVKREVTQAFGAPRSRELPLEAIVIEDSQ
eukprot:TRINITY_DN3278_c0_g1_i1.p1 TRINITY_DN3278_c0_g1~~TRINITY_DN3278_c0_g1_i1.p1  ORF type:complete len:363 (+),score=123.19 TRINITY_DN3278_c0_g1_i1:76-1164(+)